MARKAERLRVPRHGDIWSLIGRTQALQIVLALGGGGITW